MKKIKSFFSENGYIVMVVFMLFLSIQNCNQNSSIKSLRKDVKAVVATNDSMAHRISNEVKIEGLRAESRMIQATDRKMMDVQRQNQIEVEIKGLQAK